MDGFLIAILQSLPESIAGNAAFHMILTFFRKLRKNTSQPSFLKTFYDSLDELKDYGAWVKDLKKTIQKDENAFMECFAITEANYPDFIADLKEGRYYEDMAELIVERFAVPDNFKAIAVIVLKECLEDFLNQFRPLFLQAILPHHGAALKELTGLNETDLKILSIPPVKKKKERQIKVLAITASPENGMGIRYEMEQDFLLDMFASFDREEVFLDMPDPVKSSLTEIQDHLQGGFHDILLISAHGGLNVKGEGFLCLENAQGEEQQVTGLLLQTVLKPAPRVVILSACFSATTSADLLPVAQALFDAGIETVIGMKGKISDLAAIDFNEGFFKALKANHTIRESFTAGISAVVEGEKIRVRDILGWNNREEDKVPQLFTHKPNITRRDFSSHRILAPAPPQSFQFMGAQYLDRGFIGRRGILRQVYQQIERSVGGLVLKGSGGIGKSTLTTRVAAHLHQQGYDFIVIQGPTSSAGILEALGKKATALDIVGAAEVCSRNVDERGKLQWFLNQMLVPRAMVVIFDNFEDNQSPEKDGEFLNEDLKNFITDFRQCLKDQRSLLLFSSRYTVPVPGVETINLGEFSPLEFRKMLLNSKALKRLDGKSIEHLGHEIGGNPRAVELLDCIAFEEFGHGDFSWTGLMDLLPELRERLITKKAKEDGFTPLFLGHLLGYLTPVQRQVMDALCIYREPVGKEALQVQGVDIQRKDRRKLVDLSLLEYRNTPQTYYMHRLTAQYVLAKMPEPDRTERHLRAAAFFEGIVNEEGLHEIDDHIESRWHYIQAGEWDRAADLTLDLEECLTLHGYWQMSFQLIEEIATNWKELTEQKSADIFHILGMVYERFGNYDEALSHYRKSLKIFEKRGDSQGISKCLHHIGNIYFFKEDYNKAMAQYQKALDISKTLEDSWNVSASLLQIGLIYYKRSDYDESLGYFNKALEIDEKLENRQGIVKSLHEIGMIYFKKGDYDQALANYRKSLGIAEKIEDIAGMAISLAQIGAVYIKQEQYHDALELCSQSFLIFARIGSPDAENVASNIAFIRQKMPKTQFEKILKEFDIVLETDC